MQWFDRLVEVMEDWSYLIRSDGWLRALPEIGKELVHLPCRRMHLVVVACSLLEPPPKLQPKIALEAREIQACDLELVRQISRPSEVKAQSQRLAQGYIGFLILHNGQPAGYAWGTGQIDPKLQPIHIRLDPGDVLFVGAYTAPAFRGQGVSTLTGVALFRRFRELGYRRAIIIIEKRNVAPQAIYLGNAGGQVIAEIDVLRIGPWRWMHYRGRDSA